MGKLLRSVELAGGEYQDRRVQLESARVTLREAMLHAHEEGISMNKIANAAGMTREGVRYALKGASNGS